MSQFIKTVFHSAEWLSVIALSIQAVILAVQAFILRQHHKTMESQASTAESIGDALNKQDEILREQGQIMAKQFAFQRMIEAKAERSTVFRAVVDLAASVRGWPK